MPMDLTQAYRTAAIAWARTMLAHPDAVILDTETTGLGRDDEPVSIAVVDARGEVLLDTLVRPSRPISRGAMRVHGIGNSQVAGAPTFADVYDTLAGVLNDRILIVYNLDFDWRILRTGCRLYRLATFQPQARHCAMKQYAQYHGDWNPYRASYRWHSLSNACAHFGISAHAAHAALDDCRLTLEVLRRMAATPG